VALAPAAQTSNTTEAAGQTTGRYLVPLTILTSLFFMWGFLTCLNDILLPRLKSAFSLSYVEASLVQVCFFSAYFIVSLPAGALVKKLGYQRGIVVGLIIAGCGCALFYPAASIRAYWLFLGALFILGSGITILQVSANPYVTVLGPPSTASARLTLTQAFNSLATTVAPVFGQLFILTGATLTAAEAASLTAEQQEAARRAAETASVQVPYLGLAAVLVLLAVAMALFKLPVIKDEVASKVSGGAWGHKHLVLGAGAIFLYVGGEVAIGSYLINLMGLKEMGGLSQADASAFLKWYWGGAMVGRFIGSFLLSQFKPGRLLAFNATVASTLVLVSIALHGQPAMWALLSVGLFNSIMFPTIFSLALDGLGPDTTQGSGILCMAIVGGAVVPWIHAQLADSIGLHMAFIVPALCYVYIVYYGLKGSQHAPAAATT
jgi:FHS family L-fucose permease-like MFS transporter